MISRQHKNLQTLAILMGNTTKKKGEKSLRNKTYSNKLVVFCSHLILKSVGKVPHPTSPKWWVWLIFIYLLGPSTIFLHPSRSDQRVPHPTFGYVGKVRHVGPYLLQWSTVQPSGPTCYLLWSIQAIHIYSPLIDYALLGTHPLSNPDMSWIWSITRHELRYDIYGREHTMNMAGHKFYQKKKTKVLNTI